MDLGLTGKVAIVTAASRGIGRAAAEALANEGADLAICARTSGTLESTAEELRRRYGVRVFASPIDLGRCTEASAFATRAADVLGPVEILVTNTSGPPPGAFEIHSMDAWREAWRQGFESIVAVVKAVAPNMRAAGWGRVINVTSIAAKQPVDDLILSNSIRAAVGGLARTLATEFAPDGVTVNNVLPGYTRTARVEALARHAAGRSAEAPEPVREWVKSIPMARLGEPSEIAAMVAFLASRQAGYVTGQSIAADGGWIRGL